MRDSLKARGCILRPWGAHAGIIAPPFVHQSLHAFRLASHSPLPRPSPLGRNRRNSLIGGEGSVPFPSFYPMPLVPFLKVGPLRCSVVERLVAAPDEPGGCPLTCAVEVVGVQGWVSPIHVWHLVSLQKAATDVLGGILHSPIAGGRGGPFHRPNALLALFRDRVACTPGIPADALIKCVPRVLFHTYLLPVQMT